MKTLLDFINESIDYERLDRIKLNDNLTYTVKSYRSNLDIESLSDKEIYSFLEGINLDNVRLDGLFTAISTDICDYNNYRIIPSSGALSWIGNSNDQDIFENNILYSFTNDIKNLYPITKEKYSVTEYGFLQRHKPSMITISTLRFTPAERVDVAASN